MFEDWRCRLQEMTVEGFGRAELCDVLAEAAQLRAAVDAFEARATAAIAALGDRGAPASTVLRSAGRLSQREADRRAKRAETLAGSGLVESAARRPADLAAKDVREWVRREQTEAEANRLYAADGGRDGGGEARTAEQRRADALVGLLSGGGDRTGAPVRFQIPVVVTLDDDGVSAHFIESNEAVSPSMLARLAARADFFGVVFSAEGDPLWMGRRTRLATDAQWRALVARDGGCVVCDAAPSRCEAHHLIPWEHLGPTDIDNLVLICRHHHHVVHDDGWRLCQGPNGWELAPP